MPFLELPVIETLLTPMAFCGVVIVIASLVLRFSGLQLHKSLHHLLALFSFSLLGFVSGVVMANAREAAVGQVLPAVLTLLGGVAVYIISSKGVHVQILVSSLILSFTASLYAGSLYGARLRFEFDTSSSSLLWQRNHELGLEENRHAVEVQRLLNYIELLKLERDLAKKEELDLSLFATDLEKKPQERKGAGETKASNEAERPKK